MPKEELEFGLDTVAGRFKQARLEAGFEHQRELAKVVAKMTRKKVETVEATISKIERAKVLNTKIMPELCKAMNADPGLIRFNAPGVQNLSDRVFHAAIAIEQLPEASRQTLLDFIEKTYLK